MKLGSNYFLGHQWDDFYCLISAFYLSMFAYLISLSYVQISFAHFFTCRLEHLGVPGLRCDP